MSRPPLVDLSEMLAPPLTPEEAAEEAAEEAHYNRPLSPEDVCSAAAVEERLSCASQEVHEQLLQDAGIVLRPHRPEGTMRVWDWEAGVWEETAYRGPYAHPSWDGEALVCGKDLDPPYVAAEWVEVDPSIELPAGWVWGLEPGDEYVRYR